MKQTWKQRQRVKRTVEEVELSVPSAPIAKTDSADDLLDRMEELLNESR
jgi:hypothetical protein